MRSRGRISLGVHRLPMGRTVGLADARATRGVYATARRCAPMSCTGTAPRAAPTHDSRRRYCALGGKRPLCFYTPHGGSLHYGGAGTGWARC